MKDPFYRGKHTQKLTTTKIILIGLLLLLVLLLTLLGVFNELGKEVFIEFIKDMVPHVLAIMLVVFFVEHILRKEKTSTLTALNRSKSEHIYFSVNRFAYLFLEYLGVVKKVDIGDYIGKESNFEMAMEKFKEVSPKGLQKIYLQNLKDSDDKEVFVNGFTKIIENFGDAGGKMVEDIYPAPHQRMLAFFKHDLHMYRGAIGVLGEIYRIKNSPEFIKKTRKTTKKEKKEFNEGLNLIFTSELNPANEDAINLFEDIIEISELAKGGKVFSVI